MYSLLRLAIAVYMFHQGYLQMMPFPPMPFGVPNMGAPMPQAMPAPMPMGPMPAGMPPPMPMPVPFGMPQQKLPIVVMPYYSKSQDRIPKRHRRRRKKYLESDSCESGSSDTSSSSDIDFRASNRHSKGRGKRRQVLTPVVSYMTKDGYVVYQKKIKKDRAKDWLQMGRKPKDTSPGDKADEDDYTFREMKKVKYSKRKRHEH